MIFYTDQHNSQNRSAQNLKQIQIKGLPVKIFRVEIKFGYTV